MSALAGMSVEERKTYFFFFLAFFAVVFFAFFAFLAMSPPSIHEAKSMQTGIGVHTKSVTQNLQD
jgi:hypothetical protein